MKWPWHSRDRDRDERIRRLSEASAQHSEDIRTVKERLSHLEARRRTVEAIIDVEAARVIGDGT